jgi:hypothetical protein
MRDHHRLIQVVMEFLVLLRSLTVLESLARPLQLALG